MPKKILLVGLFLLGLSLAQAHEFWLQPRKYRYQMGEKMEVDFMVGENFAGEFWDLGSHKVERLEMHPGVLVKNLSKDVKPTKGKNLVYTFDQEGTHVLALESNEAYIELEGEKFNAYLEEDGIENILDERTQSGELGKPSREFYKRYAKLIVQCGSLPDENFRKRIGFRYEIIPLVNPYTLQTGDYLECRVLWENKPAAHAMVKVWNHIGHRSFLQNIYTEDDGTIKFPISTKGPWMVSAVKMVHAQRKGADYQSLWTSLVFGIE